MRLCSDWLISSCDKSAGEVINIPYFSNGWPFHWNGSGAATLTRFATAVWILVAKEENRAFPRCGRI